MLASRGLLLAVLSSSVFSTGLVAAALALTVAHSLHTIRIVRSVAEEQFSKDYVLALRVQGFSTAHLTLHDVLPNLRTFVLGQASVTLAWSTVDIAALPLLGLGVQPRRGRGVVVAAGQSSVLQGYPAESISAGLCLVVAVVSFVVVSQRLARRADEHAADRRPEADRRPRP